MLAGTPPALELAFSARGELALELHELLVGLVGPAYGEGRGDGASVALAVDLVVELGAAGDVPARLFGLQYEHQLRAALAGLLPFRREFIPVQRGQVCDRTLRPAASAGGVLGAALGPGT